MNNQIREGPSVLIPSVLTKVQNLFNEGREVSEVSEKLKIKKDTLRKAINSGRLIAPSPQKQRENTSLVEVETSTKSERIIEDNSSPIGMGATNMFGRMAASLGKLGNMEPMFTSCLDVPYAGVLWHYQHYLSMEYFIILTSIFNYPRVIIDWTAFFCF
jgi:hypothetical protein